MHGKKQIKSECDFIGFKNNRLNYKCKEWGKRYSKLIDQGIKNFPIMYPFCNGNLNKFVFLLKKAFILMNTWTVGKDLMKHQYRLKKLFTANKFRRYYR